MEAPRSGDPARPVSLFARIRAGDREAAAELLRLYGPLIRRRVRGKLSHNMRRIFDSQDLWATVARRFDGCVTGNSIEAQNEAELVGFLQKMIDTAVVDKFRAFNHLSVTDQQAAQSPVADAELANLSRADVDAAIDSLPNPTDREIITLWMQGHELQQIAGIVGLTPENTRYRWMGIRRHLAQRWGKEFRA